MNAPLRRCRAALLRWVGRSNRAALLLPVLLLATGCSQLQPLIAEPAPAAGRAPVDLSIDAPDALKPLLEKHLDLARLLSLPTDEAPSNAEVNRLIRAAPAQARGLLQTEGYFDAQVSVQRERVPQPGDAAAPGEAAQSAVDDSSRPRDRLQRVRIAVVPGDPTQVSTLKIELEGELHDRVGRGEADAVKLAHSLASVSALQPGMVFRNADWSAAKQALQARLRAAGYAAVRLQDSRADVDVATHSARLLIVLDSGPLFRAGPLQVSGLNRQDERTVRNLADFDTGAPLTEERLLDYQERLQASRLFQSASVSFEPDPLVAPLTPVQVRVGELPLQQLTVGVGVATDTGARVTLEHTHRRPFDLPVIAYNKFELGQRNQKWVADIQTHPGPRLYRNLLGLEIEREESDSDVVLSQQLRLGRTQDSKRLERLYFVELLRSRRDVLTVPVTYSTVDSGPSIATALSANAHFVRRDLDNLLLPTRGLVAALQIGVGQATSDSGADGPFTRLYTRLTGYRPLGSAWYGQARLELGSIVKRSDVLVPDALGFRAGGDDSVRGYGYRDLAPTDATGARISGNVLMTSSLELARPILASMPSVWGAVFVDAGNAAMDWADLEPVLGYGVGVRWRSPVGPLRVDVAYGQEVQKFRLHLSVGINF